MASPSSPALQRIHSLDISSPDFEDRLHEILYEEEYTQAVLILKGDDLDWLVDYLDNALGRLEFSGRTYRKCLRELRDLCGNKGKLPSSYLPPPHALEVLPKPFCEGSYGDVFKGTFESRVVCVKRIKIYEKYGYNKSLKVLCKEAVIWKHLEHPNILSLFWITLEPLQLVSEWMPGGELSHYIKENPHVSRIGLLSDVANGLCYLHSRNIVHGDLKGPNILVDCDGRARISDFGLTTVTQNPNSNVKVTCPSYTLRWCAPEILKDEGHSKGADIFSFAMVMVEVFTGKVPFDDKRDFALVFLLVSGKRPPRPEHPALTDPLWEMMQRCWDDDPNLRPEVSDVAKIISGLGSELLGQFVQLDPSSPDFDGQLRDILYGESYERCIPTLKEDDFTWLVDYLDQALDRLEPSSATTRKCLRELKTICRLKGILPTSYKSPSGDLKISVHPFAQGGFGDLYQASVNDRKVCVKRLRLPKEGLEQAIVRAACEEAVMWKSLSHPNIVPLLWVTLDPPQFVSEWISDGEILSYIEKTPDTDRVMLLTEIADGLSYIHSREVIHGDIKPHNILVQVVGNKPHARITDFGTTIVTQNVHSIRAPTPHTIRTEMYSAPEVLSCSNPSHASDVYSFGMVMFTIFAGEHPFEGKTIFAAAFGTLRGDRPRRPTHPTCVDHMWALMQSCWEHEPSLRPKISDVFGELQASQRGGV